MTHPYGIDKEGNQKITRENSVGYLGSQSVEKEIRLMRNKVDKIQMMRNICIRADQQAVRTIGKLLKSMAALEARAAKSKGTRRVLAENARCSAMWQQVSDYIAGKLPDEDS